MVIEPNLYSCCTQDQTLEVSSLKSLNKMKKKIFEYNKSVKRHPFTRKDKQFLIAERQLILLTVNKAAKQNNNMLSFSHSSRQKIIGLSNPILKLQNSRLFFTSKSIHPLIVISKSILLSRKS
jgi:hypothetical protein